MSKQTPSTDAATTVVDAVPDTATILVVDDHDENVLALKAMLDRPGVEILSARSGTDALRLVLKHDFAVILLDVIMPIMDGFETARMIRTRDASKHTPIIFLTAAGSDIDMVYRGYHVGAVDYLVKPLNPEIVTAKVAVFVDLFRKTRQVRRQAEALRIAERERGEAALRESDRLYEASFDAAAVGIGHAALDGRWLRANPRLCQILGYPLAELLSLGCRDVTHPDDAAEAAAGLHALLSGAMDTYHREQRYLHKDGHVVWVDLTVSLLYDGAGRPKHFVNVAEDVTERRREEVRQRLLSDAGQILLQSLDHRSTIDDVARLTAGTLGDWCAIGILGTDDDDVRVSISHADPDQAADADHFRQKLIDSPSFCRALRGPLPEMAADFSELAVGEWNLDPSGWALLQKIGCGATMVIPLHIRHRILGQIIFVSAGAGRRFGRGDLVTARDLAQRITLGIENARLYREAQNAVRARDEFLSIASHELRTPLTPLQIHFQRLLGENGQELTSRPERLQRVLERCERQVRRLESLMDNLLDVSRISSGRLRLQAETVDLAKVVGEVSERFAEELSAAGCQLLLENGVPVLGQWDRLRIEQVVTNLLGNALKYGSGEPIEITVQETPEGGRLRVRDHGIGIKEDDRERIFQRFQRAVSSRSYGGLGLGLYITRQIVDAHYGTIHVESGSGSGSVFVVDLPRAGPQSAEITGEQTLRA